MVEYRVSGEFPHRLAERMEDQTEFHEPPRTTLTIPLAGPSGLEGHPSEGKVL